MGSALLRCGAVKQHVRQLGKIFCKAQLAISHGAAIFVDIIEVVLYSRLHTHYAGRVCSAAAQVFFLPSAHLTACELCALPEVQYARTLGSMYLVSAYGIQVAVFRIEGHLQKALDAVYMEQRLRSPAPEHPAYGLGVVHSTNLIVHLHYRYKAGVRGDEALQPFQVYHAGIVYRRFDNVVLAGKGFIYLIYRRMLGRADYYPAPAPHCFKGSEYCHIVAFSAA